MRQQTAALYAEHHAYVKRTEKLEADNDTEQRRLREELEAAQVKLEHLQHLVQLEGEAAGAGGNGADAPPLQRRLRELTRQVMALEVNELKLKRRHISLEEQRVQEEGRRCTAERDMIEQEKKLRGRLLYLELWKQGASARLSRLSAALDTSVSAPEFHKTTRELEALRADHLILMQDEATVRADAAALREKAQRATDLEAERDILALSVASAEHQAETLHQQLQEQQELTRTAVAASMAGREGELALNDMVSEIAKWRGDAARLEVRQLK